MLEIDYYPADTEDPVDYRMIDPALFFVLRF